MGVTRSVAEVDDKATEDLAGAVDCGTGVAGLAGGVDDGGGFDGTSGGLEVLEEPAGAEVGPGGLGKEAGFKQA